MEWIKEIKRMNKQVDPETGSILFHAQDTRGVPDKVMHGPGYTLEFQKGRLLLIDLYDPTALGRFLAANVEDEAIEE